MMRLSETFIGMRVHYSGSALAHVRMHRKHRERVGTITFNGSILKTRSIGYVRVLWDGRATSDSVNPAHLEAV